MDREQTALGDSMLDSPATQSQTPELVPRDHAVLPTRELSHSPITTARELRHSPITTKCTFAPIVVVNVPLAAHEGKLTTTGTHEANVGSGTVPCRNP
jgi:hypothetical protein